MITHSHTHTDRKSEKKNCNENSKQRKDIQATTITTEKKNSAN